MEWDEVLDVVFDARQTSSFVWGGGAETSHLYYLYISARLYIYRRSFYLQVEFIPILDDFYI